MVELNFRTLGAVLIGLSIILIFLFSFVKSNIDKEESFLCNTVHANPGLNIEQCPAHESNNSWLLLVAFGIVFMVLISGIYLLFMPITNLSKNKEEHREFKKVDISKLDKEERVVYETLKKNNGSMYQSNIIKETQYSKVRTTRILDRLYNRGIIDRQRRGMTNIVILR